MTGRMVCMMVLNKEDAMYYLADSVSPPDHKATADIAGWNAL
jgi:hypothetical protein